MPTMPMVLHPAQLSFAPESSCKGDPEQHISLKICAQIINTGFLSANDVLKVTELLGLEAHPNMPFGGPKMFSVGHVKGSARINVLLAICMFFIQDGESIEQASAEGETFSNLRHPRALGPHLFNPSSLLAGWWESRRARGGKHSSGLHHAHVP